MRFIIPILVFAACGSTADPDPEVHPIEPDPVASVDPDTGIAEVAIQAIVAAPPPPEALPVEAPSSTWVVRRGESLAHYARWAELPVETIAEASGLRLDNELQVGAMVTVPGDEATRGRVETGRDRHHRVRATRYLDGRGGAQGTSFYTVRSGDTAWKVANDEIGVPVWLLETYNPSVDLERLRPGQQLMVPVLVDSVAELPELPATPGIPEAP